MRFTSRINKREAYREDLMWMTSCDNWPHELWGCSGFCSRFQSDDSNISRANDEARSTETLQTSPQAIVSLFSGVPYCRRGRGTHSDNMWPRINDIWSLFSRLCFRLFWIVTKSKFVFTGVNWIRTVEIGSKRDVRASANCGACSSGHLFLLVAPSFHL